MAIKCGNRMVHGADVVYHDSPAAVRACYDRSAEPPPHGYHPSDREDHFSWAKGDMHKEPMWPASPKQIDYVLGLQRERRLPDEYTVKTEADLKGMERDEVSSLITVLKTFPRRNDGQGARTEWTMPAGRYALEVNDQPKWQIGRESTYGKATRIRFFQVDKPTTGRWKGYTFIKELIGSPGDYRKVELSRENRDRALRLIERDPQEAMQRYGREAMVCGKCFSPLTNEESRTLGIGPVCRGKMGW